MKEKKERTRVELLFIRFQKKDIWVVTNTKWLISNKRKIIEIRVSGWGDPCRGNLETI